VSASELGIRAADVGDLGALVELEAGAFTDPWSPPQVFAELEDGHAFVLIALGGTPPAPLGFAVFRHIAGEAELLRLGVSPNARRHGVGRRLTEAGLARLRELRCDGCYLEVRTNNTGAIALYESLDFRRTGTRRGYYSDGSDALLMKRDLGDLGARS
jgi:ribosomal-protein-alanine acetyltransferase